MNLVEFVIFGFAVWRLSSLLVREDGPFDILAKFRHKIGVYYDERSKPQGKNVIAKAFTCVWCLSVWVALPAAASLNLANVRNFIVLTLALSGLAVLIDSFVKK